MNQASLAILLCFASLPAFAGTAAKDPTIVAAESAAKSWLALADRGDYAASWKAAAPNLQSRYTSVDWGRLMQRSRKPMGKMLERHLRIRNETQHLAGEPDGDYVVIQYQTKFAHKANTLETIAPVKQPDGSWKVASYTIW